MNVGQNFGIVIVAYNPNIPLLEEKLKDYSKATKFVVVVNNGHSLKFNIRNCHLINLGENKGIAYAQNVGADYLKKNNIEYLFFLDQDSTVRTDFFAKMLEQWQLIYANDHKIGVLSPVAFDVNLNKFLTISQLTSQNVERKVVNDFHSNLLKNTLPISSGVLTKTSIFDEVGGNDSWMFIDWVDFDFDMSMLKHGYHIYTTYVIKIEHSIGKSKSHKFLWKSINVSNHNSFREFYFFRNGIYFYRKYKNIYPQLKPYIRHALCTRIIFVLYEKNKFRRIANIVRGLNSGFKVKIDEV